MNALSGPADPPLETWPDALEAALGECTLLRAVRVVRQTASTQDAASGLPAGTAVVAWQQTAGRGRLGSAWADTGHAGLAVTAVIPRAQPEHLATASAVAAAAAVAACGGAAADVRIKWPNDLVLHARKLAGILVEQRGQVALVGVGINVHQQGFEPPLHARATSLRMAGVTANRLDLACRLLQRLDHWLRQPPGDVAAAYRARDCMAGQVATFETPHGQVTGAVIAVDPTRGLTLETPSGTQFLPAATTRVVPPAL